MPERKTVATGGSVAEFVASIEDPRKRADADALLTLLTSVTGQQPAMWGPSIIGFGSSHYSYASGREGDTFIVGFSPRQQNLVLYVGMLEQHHQLLNRLGPHRLGKGCLYIKRLIDVDSAVLRQLLEEASQHPRR
jgi:hypothetical protein